MASAPADLLLMVWTDLAAEADEAAFNEWYQREHIPDRVKGIDGFLAARRFSAIDGGPRYLTLYELGSEDVLTSPSYLRLRSEPDANSSRFIPHFRNVLRSISRPAVEFGLGEGSFICFAAFGPGGDVAALVREHGPRVASRIGIVRVRLFEARRDLENANSSGIGNSARTRLRPPDRFPDRLLMVEATSRAALDDPQITGLFEAVAKSAPVMGRIHAQQLLRLAR
ncbi:MAG: hypothetical protein ABTQ31_17885 [Rhizobiaceae bacterium]